MAAPVSQGVSTCWTVPLLQKHGDVIFEGKSPWTTIVNMRDFTPLTVSLWRKQDDAPENVLSSRPWSPVSFTHIKFTYIHIIVKGTHHKTGFLLNISAALKNKLQTCWLLKKIVYTDKKKTRFLIYTNSPMVLCAIRRLCAYATRQEQSSEEKKMFPLSMFFSSYQMLCPFFLKQNVLPLGPLATLARLHDHIRQLLHLEMRTISVIRKCCFILDAL